MNNWQKAAAEYRKNQWRAYREQYNWPEDVTVFIPGAHEISYDVDPCPKCAENANTAELYGAFEAGWPQ